MRRTDGVDFIVDSWIVSPMYEFQGTYLFYSYRYSYKLPLEAFFCHPDIYKAKKAILAVKCMAKCLLKWLLKDLGPK